MEMFRIVFYISEEKPRELVWVGNRRESRNEKKQKKKNFKTFSIFIYYFVLSDLT